MRTYNAFLKKEFTQMTRTYKLMIMCCVFLLFGILSPVTAKFMPDLMSSFMPDGMNITIPEPSAIDSWMQFFKNISQMGMLVMVIVFSGIISNEISKGTLINMLTKGLPRWVVIMSKFTSAALLWTLAYVVSFVATFYYTQYFWNTSTPNLIFSVFCLWLFGVMLIAVEILAGVIVSNSYAPLLCTGGFVATLFILNIPIKFKEYNPIMLVSGNVELLTKAKEVSDFTFPLVLTVIIIVTSVTLAVISFNKKKL